MDKVNFTNGKWRLSAQARESGDFEYRSGDWFPKEKKKSKAKPKLVKTTKKMNCGFFPLDKIKEICQMTILYTLSGILGISLALNVIWYFEKRQLEQQNLELLEIISK